MSIIVQPPLIRSPMGQKNLVVIAGYRINGSFYKNLKCMAVLPGRAEKRWP